MNGSLKKVIGWTYLGRVPYQRANYIQNFLLNEKKSSSSSNLNLNILTNTPSSPLSPRSNKTMSPREDDTIPDILLLLEHPPTFTMGRRGGVDTGESSIGVLENAFSSSSSSSLSTFPSGSPPPLVGPSLSRKLLKVEKERLESLGAEFIHSSRGGLITFHGPGQLVGYPILNLKNFKRNLNWYVCALQKTLINTCAAFDIKADTTDDVGVWVEENRKIAAIGFHVSKWITTHGFSLNVDLDLSWFEYIIPCGLEDKEVTSISEELTRSIRTSNYPATHHITVGDSIPKVIQSFGREFECHILPLEEMHPSLCKRIHELAHTT